jgi:hypothetical protein
MLPMAPPALQYGKPGVLTHLPARLLAGRLVRSAGEFVTRVATFGKIAPLRGSIEPLPARQFSARPRPYLGRAFCFLLRFRYIQRGAQLFWCNLQDFQEAALLGRGWRSNWGVSERTRGFPLGVSSVVVGYGGG